MGCDFFGAENVAITYTCSQEFLSGAEGNQVMLVSPFEMGPNGELFLEQGPQNLCVDTGSDAEADVAYLSTWGEDWQAMTTANNSALDVPPVDMGMHYFP